MAFVVEDGTVVANATSLVAVATAKAYWDDVGFDWTIYSPDTKIQRALVKATRYIEFRFKFKGHVVNDTQVLSWPRCGVYNKEGVYIEENVVPKQVQEATIEYAQRALVTDLAPDAVVDETGQQLKRSLSKIGPIEEEKVYFQGNHNLLQAYPSADYLLRDLVVSSKGRTYVL